ncbi:MAG: UDP-3-O-(3-hydroxymyristoyl)glucosamine N-acyltransferase [Gammaproteobacteria bacterium]|nr:UDP-3-O-(3-hydroxymyristoyl)glucosamine N-acyltransferase [Gammaproteobacteria bacterium]
MQYSLGKIAEFLQAELRGDADYSITSIAPLATAKAPQISFLGRVPGFVPSARQYLTTTQAGAVILTAKDAEDYTGNALLVENPYLSYAKLTNLFSLEPKAMLGIHANAAIGQNCQIPDSVSIGANCAIGNNVTIGENTVIEAGCAIGDGVTIGANCQFYPNVTIYYGIKIGAQVILHSGAVIGADGFGMANEAGRWCKIHQLGGVSIGNDVEIGANSCVDRGALEDTIIEDGVKLDNQIQIGHNARIGAHTIIAGCSAVAGSTTIGKHCILGGAVNVNGHINLADQVIITAASAVEKDITTPGVYSGGLAAQPQRKWLRIRSLIQQLDEIVSRPKKPETKK